MADKIRSTLDGIMDVFASFFVRILFLLSGQL